MPAQKRRALSPPESDQAVLPKRAKVALNPRVTEDIATEESSLEVPDGDAHPNWEIVEEGEWAQKYYVEGLPGAKVYYEDQFIDEATANRWYAALCELETWYRPTLSMYGKPYVQSRSIASYATSSSLNARYSGHSVKMNYPYPPLLKEIQGVVSEKLGIGFDHVMLNWYQDGSVHIGKHRDTRDNQVIASLSLGAKRTFVMHPHISKGEQKIAGAELKRWILGNGSLLVMQGETQENWKHEIPKEPKVKEGRISLTFRQLVHQGR